MRWKYLWVSGVIFFGFGDVLTTFIGIQFLGGIEENYLPALLIESYGLWIIFPAKFGHILFLYGLYKVIPNPFNLPVPILINLFGIVVTISNSHEMYLIYTA